MDKEYKITNDLIVTDYGTSGVEIANKDCGCPETQAPEIMIQKLDLPLLIKALQRIYDEWK